MLPFVLAGAFVAMMMIGGLASWLLVRAPAREPPPIYTIDRRQPAVPPKAELGAQIDGTTRNGLRFWLVEYRNIGESEISNASIVVSLFDASGARVAEQKGFSVVKRLQPGKATTIMVLLDEATEYARSEITMVEPSSNEYGLPEVELTIADFRENPTFGSLRDVIGTIRNPHPRAVRFVNVLVVGRDANEQPVSYATGISSQREIPAGGESGFSVSVGTFEIEPPKKWEVIVVGSPL